MKSGNLGNTKANWLVIMNKSVNWQKGEVGLLSTKTKVNKEYRGNLFTDKY